MKNIITNHDYAAAADTLAKLHSALTAARAEESRLISLLARTPGKSTTPLSAALALLSGAAPERTDLQGLQQALDSARLKINTLVHGIEAQQQAVATVRDELSATASRNAQQAHAKAAESIASAIEVLGAALAAEVALRADIEAAGYRCTLPALQLPDHLDTTDKHGMVRQFQRQCSEYATDTADHANGKLDKPGNVKLLTASEHGQVGDVVALPGVAARMLQRLGLVEPTTLKPNRVPRLKAWEITETVLS